MPTPPASSPAVTSRPAAVAAAPWWRFAMVWFVLAGPAVVVVAALATATVAFRNADTVVVEAAPHAAGDAARLSGATTPALQARNHAATPAR
ncbi:MAG: nitrogen fixation protein FixH [Caldimonas sp.]